MKKQVMKKCIGGLVAAVLLYSGCSQKEDPGVQEPVQKPVPSVQEPVPASRPEPPNEPQRHNGVTIDLIAGDHGLYSGIHLKFSRDAQRVFAQYAPVHYEIPELDITFPLPLERGLAIAKTTFKEPKDALGKLVIIYGTDRHTKQTVELYRERLED